MGVPYTLKIWCISKVISTITTYLPAIIASWDCFIWVYDFPVYNTGEKGQTKIGEKKFKTGNESNAGKPILATCFFHNQVIFLWYFIILSYC